MSLSARGERFLNHTQAKARGVVVSYARGEQQQEITVWAGNSPGDVEEAGRAGSATRQARLQTGEREYLIPASEMTRAGFGVPAVGDRVTEAFDGTPVTFEVRPVLGQPPWTWSDTTHRTRYRVTTKQV